MEGTKAPQTVRTVDRKKPQYRIKKSCYCCGRVAASPHHVIPRSEGGLPIFDNIVWLCIDCHDAVEGPSVGARDRLEQRKAEIRGRRQAKTADSKTAMFCSGWYSGVAASEHDVTCAVGETAKPERQRKAIPDAYPFLRDIGEGVEVRQAWPGGPPREFCRTRPSKNWGIPHASGLYANRYVCSACKQPVSGVYEPEWLCGTCRSSLAENPYLQVGKTGIPARHVM